MSLDLAKDIVVHRAPPKHAANPLRTLCNTLVLYANGLQTNAYILSTCALLFSLLMVSGYKTPNDISN